MVEKNLKIGVLAMQGAFIEHVNALHSLEVETALVRKKEDLENIDGLIIPGGESTAMTLLLEKKDLFDEIRRLIKNGLPVFGTCAGAILLAKKINGKKLAKGLEVMDIEIERNAYGSQLESFEEDLEMNINGGNKKFHAVFIRAPKVSAVGKNVNILARSSNNDIVLAKERNMLISTFHPELTNDTSIHKYFLSVLFK